MPARYFGLIPAAGTGSRFGGEIPKQYQALNGRTVLSYAIDALSRQTPLAKVYVIHALEDRRCAQVIGTGNRVVALGCGGESRAESVRNALAALRGELLDQDWMIVHDAARPCLPKDALRRLIMEVTDDKTGGLLALPVSDTLKRVDDEERAISTQARDGLWQAQTPQMFRFGVLWDAYKANRALECVDDAQAVERTGLRPKIVLGSKANIEITLAADLALAAAILRGNDGMRIGHGFDVHALAAGRPLVIGGVTIPFERGLAGHSDADVLLHAICDALLGAAGLGDIGEHFPDTSAEYAGADSRRLLRSVAEQLATRNWMILNVDATVIAQAPRMAPYKDQMTANIAADLGIDRAQVNVKAKTTERLGFTGRGEGIAAEAVALIVPQPAPEAPQQGA